MPPDWGKVVAQLLAEHERATDARLPIIVAEQVASAIAERNNEAPPDMAAALIAAEIARQFENLPRVTGALITRDGDLVLVYSDGRNERLGPVIGPAGPQGAIGPAGQDGTPGTPGERGEQGPRGRDGVGIAGAAFNRSGELMLTLSDGVVLTLDRIEKGDPGPQGQTGEAGPPGPQGPPGPSGQAWRHRRTFDPAAAYDEGDVVAHDGGSWLALYDAPGELPGPGWAQLTVRGQRGKPGEPGTRGPAGPAGRGIADIAIAENGDALVVRFTDGTERALSLVTR